MNRNEFGSFGFPLSFTRSAGKGCLKTREIGWITLLVALGNKSHVNTRKDEAFASRMVPAFPLYSVAWKTK
jgi:hypothetical protein